MKKNGSILLISGPSGVGKSSLISELTKELEDIYFSVSLTTREKREGEIDGVDYHFVSKEEFEKDIEDGFFLEWANVHGNYYGTSLKDTLNAINQGKLVIFDIDVQGFLQVKDKMEKVITSVFITAPNKNELKNRLIKRGTDKKGEIKKRLDNALDELRFAKEYDYLIINDNLDRAKKELLSIAIASRVKSSTYNLEKFIANW